MGCKGKFHEWITDDGLLTVKGYAREGLSNIQIADRIGIRETTLYEWIDRFPEFSKAIKEGRSPVAVKVEDAFYSKCEWNDYTETRQEITEHPNGTVTKRTVVINHKIPPDTAALIFALKNLYPNKYRDKPVSGDDRSDLLKQAKELLGEISSAIE